MRELDKSLNREAYPGHTDALVSDCTEEEVKGFMVARRALVCSYLSKLQSFRERVTLKEKTWDDWLDWCQPIILSGATWLDEKPLVKSTHHEAGRKGISWWFFIMQPSMGFHWGMCFSRQNYSLTLSHVKHFPLFCHCSNFEIWFVLLT